MTHTISVFSPASIANLCSGFDVCGIAVEGLGDELTISHSIEQQFKFAVVGEHGHEVPTVPEKNAATVPILSFCKERGILPYFNVTLNKKMPIGSGLGSSGSSAAAGIFALNSLLELNQSKGELLTFAAEGERVACGAGHADNVAASLYGGAVIISQYDPLHVISVPIANKKLSLAIIHPQIILKTKYSRSVLPESVALKLAVSQLGAFGALIAGLTTGENEHIKLGLVDHIAEPKRAHLIPGFIKAKEIALRAAGCLGFGIAGSGPSMFAMCESIDAAAIVCQEITSHLNRISVGASTFVSQIDQQGCKVINQE